MKSFKLLLPLLLLISFLIINPSTKNDLEIKRVVLQQQKQDKVEKTQMLYFGATWCSPCKKMKQLFKDPEVKKELDRLDFRMYDIDIDAEMTRKYNITKVPTTIFQAEGKMGTRYTGSIPKSQLLQILRSIKD
tara:strand:+ start:1647 stop:2045 length:399 start_codon:yes stop_codon:yes gene_type:complete